MAAVLLKRCYRTFCLSISIVSLVWWLTACSIRNTQPDTATLSPQGVRWQQYTAAGEAAYMQGHYTEAEQQWTAALTEAEDFGLHDLRLPTSLYNLALLYDTQGRYVDAELLYQTALTLREQVLGPEHPSIVPLLESYAALLRRTHRTIEAEQLENRARAIRTAYFRENTTH